MKHREDDDVADGGSSHRERAQWGRWPMSASRRGGRPRPAPRDGPGRSKRRPYGTVYYRNDGRGAARPRIASNGSTAPWDVRTKAARSAPSCQPQPPAHGTASALKTPRPASGEAGPCARAVARSPSFPLPGGQRGGPGDHGRAPASPSRPAIEHIKPIATQPPPIRPARRIGEPGGGR
jgi:hypothetical protein